MKHAQDTHESAAAFQYRLRALFGWTAVIALWLGLARHLGFLLFLWPLSIPIGLVEAALLRLVTGKRFGTTLAAFEGATTAAALLVCLLLLSRSVVFTQPQDLGYFPLTVIFVVVSVLGSVFGSEVVTASRIGIGNAVLAALRIWNVAGVGAWLAISIHVILANRGNHFGLTACIYGTVFVLLLAPLCGLSYSFVWGACRKLTAYYRSRAATLAPGMRPN